MAEKACKKCRLIVSGEACPNCNASEFAKGWEGYIFIEDPEGSEVASTIGAKAPGKYALKIK